jgi:hypothetical protein
MLVFLGDMGGGIGISWPEVDIPCVKGDLAFPKFLK